MEIRRKDRQITDEAQIDAVLRRCDCIRLAFACAGAPYIVPMNFGFVHEAGGPRLFYLHCARRGRKLDEMRRAPRVGFELDTGHGVITAPEACGWAFRFQSVIGTGTLEEVTDPAGRRRGLQCLMAQYSGRADWAFSEAELQAAAILRLTVEELCCKQHE